MEERTATHLKRLHSEDGVERLRAREALVEIGRPVVPSLILLMGHESEQVRWEACKALGSIADPSAASHLVAALKDPSSEVRWLAAEALIAIKGEAVDPILQALGANFDSEPVLLHGAHHVLGALKKQDLLNRDTLDVLDKLSSLEPQSFAAFSDQVKRDRVPTLAKAASEKRKEAGA